MLAFSYLLAEKFSCSALLKGKEFGIVSNLRFISRTNFVLSCVEHEKSFITSGPGLILRYTIICICCVMPMRKKNQDQLVKLESK